MLNLKIIGAGAAGNKAAIALLKNGFNPNDVTLINSTIKDIPEEYKDNAIIFGASSNALGGCGKERDIGKALILEDLKSGKINLDNIVDPDTNAVVIVSSTEGGSGSAITPVIAKYLKEVIGVPVITALLFGFNSDVRGMQNSIEICQELQDNYGVIGISNAKFLEITGNVVRAEQLANDEFVNIINIICGKDIIPGRQNIDDTDLYKLVTTPGYMAVLSTDVKKCKSKDQYCAAIIESIVKSVLIDCSEAGAKRIGVIYDMSDSIYSATSANADPIVAAYGVPYEMYTHIQDTSSNRVTWIASGLPMPIDELKEIYQNYLENSKKVNKKKDDFFDNVLSMQGDIEDDMFNMLDRKEKTKSKDNFFEEYGLKTKRTNQKKKIDTTDEY